VESDVLLASRRRCCVCVFLLDREDVRKGQLAHLNGDSSRSSFDNLVWLCLEHHDEFDSRPSQSKGLTTREVRQYRESLYARFGWTATDIDTTGTRNSPARVKPRQMKSRQRSRDSMAFTKKPWRPLFLESGEPIMFAYKAYNRADGICLVERIDLPDRRVVIAAIQVTGNPGASISNSAEELCQQVWECLDIPAERLVWLEHYDDGVFHDPTEWTIVEFGRKPPAGPFAYPNWAIVTPAVWADLGLKPKVRLTHVQGHFRSKLKKLFRRPTWSGGAF
jgi:hypothetical protein